MDLVIRNYENTDYEVVRRLLIESFPEVNEELDKGLSDSTVLDLDKDKYIQIVAYNDENVIGYALASRSYDPIMRKKNLWIDYVCVNPNERGKGIARQLLQEIEKIAREEGILKLELTSSRFRTGARKLYVDFGFVIRESDIFRKVLD